jgi:predicted neuraminidase
VFLGPTNEEVWLLAPINYGAWCSGGTRLFLKRSYDQGETWTDLELLEVEQGLLGKNKPLIEDNFCLIPLEREAIWSATFLRSGNGGRDWELVGDLGKAAGAHLIQPTIVRLGNGQLMAYMRSQENYIFASYSEDEGSTWTLPKATHLPNNNSGIDMVRLASGRLVLVHNPTQLQAGLDKLEVGWPTQMPVGFQAWGPRTPLVVTVSDDEGETWKTAMTLEEGPGVYSYPAVIQGTDGTVHITYTYRRTAIRHATITETELNEICK